MRILKLLLTLLVFAGVATAQPRRSVPTSTTSSGGIRKVGVLPATCSPTSGTNIVFLTLGNVGLYQCLSSNTWTRVQGASAAGDGTSSSGLVLPELAANGTNDFRIYGADSQTADGCIVVAGSPSNGQVLKGTGTTVTIDEKTCVVMEWGSGGAVTKVTMTQNLPFGGVNAGGTGYPASGVRIPATNSPTLGVQETGTYGTPVLQFAKGTTDPLINVETNIPANWDGGAMTLSLRRMAGSGTDGNAIWQARGACIGDGDNLSNPTWPAGWTQVTDAVVAGSTTSVSFGDFTRQGCAAGEILQIQLQRLTSSGSDAFTGSLYTPALVLSFDVDLK